MGKILKYTIKFGILYLGINWLADNPQAIDFVRDCMNQCVSVGINAISTIIGSV
tara:strand:- start:1850 stop:2011 length:162 start_codon:yes stop_codon:yes gene_type:complete